MAKTKETKKDNLEREYIIPLRRKFQHVARYKKTPKAIKTVKEFLVKHMKIYDRDLNKIKIDKNLNEFLWARGIKNPPHKIRVKAIKDRENIRVELIDYPNKLKFKKAREEKLGKDAKERIESKKTMMQRVKEGIQRPKEEKEESEKSETETEEKEEEKPETKKEDKNKEKIEDAKEKEAKIKEETSKEAEEKIEKDLAKEQKHTIKVKSGKEELGEKDKYDQRSQRK